MWQFQQVGFATWNLLYTNRMLIRHENSDSVRESTFFTHIIDFPQLLKS
jgi:hypothetical protein